MLHENLYVMKITSCSLLLNPNTVKVLKRSTSTKQGYREQKRKLLTDIHCGWDNTDTCTHISRGYRRNWAPSEGFCWPWYFQEWYLKEIQSDGLWEKKWRPEGKSQKDVCLWQQWNWQLTHISPSVMTSNGPTEYEYTHCSGNVSPYMTSND